MANEIGPNIYSILHELIDSLDPVDPLDAMFIVSVSDEMFELLRAKFHRSSARWEKDTPHIRIGEGGFNLIVQRYTPPDVWLDEMEHANELRAKFAQE